MFLGRTAQRTQTTWALDADHCRQSIHLKKTLQRVEEGDYGGSIGIYASVLHALGLLDGLEGLSDSVNDELGRELSTKNLPKRVRKKSGG